MGHDDPTTGPYQLPGADEGISVTFDSDGHPVQLGLDVPGAAQGSDQATIDLTPGHPAAPADSGWMPNPDPGPTVDFMHMPPPEGFHWDPITHIPVPDAAAAPVTADPGAEATGGYGDYPDPGEDEVNA